MQPLFGNEGKQDHGNQLRSPTAGWFAKGLGFIGSAVIVWIVLKMLTPVLADSPRLTWIANVWIRTAIAAVIAIPIAALLAKIEGTIWARYYVIVGYLFSLGLIIWMVLKLLNYI